MNQKIIFAVMVISGLSSLGLFFLQDQINESNKLFMTVLYGIVTFSFVLSLCYYLKPASKEEKSIASTR